MIKFKRDEIPKGTCFSHEGMCGSYYEDTDPGERKTWHQYDISGDVCRSTACPNSQILYYISDKYGNPLPGVRRSFYQFMCKHEYGAFKLTTAKYQTTKEAQLARAKDSRWTVLDAYVPSYESRFVVEEPKWQWIFEVEPGTNGFTDRFNMTGLLTHDEAYKKFNHVHNILSYKKYEV